MAKCKGILMYAVHLRQIFKTVNLTGQSSGYILHHWRHPEG